GAAGLLTGLTSSGRPRVLWRTKDTFFRHLDGDAPARLAAIHEDVGTFASANHHTARRLGLALADAHFALIAFDYLTSILCDDGRDFATCVQFVAEVDTHLRTLDPVFYDLPADPDHDPRLPTNVIIVEQVNARTPAGRRRATMRTPDGPVQISE